MMMYAAAGFVLRHHGAHRILLGMLLAGLLAGTGARAQSIDYSAMEQLFGEPVTTSVTGKPQRATDAPANIEIITQDDIRRSGATTIPEVLQFVTGMNVRFYGIGNADVGMRGYNQTANPHLMVLVDGRQVYMVDYGRVVWEAIPVQLDEIRQIEVIKGPNSALYGFNAVGGVINIITYDPRTEPVNRATLGGGTQDFHQGSVVATGKAGDNAGLRLSLGGFNANEFAPGGLNSRDQATLHSPFTGTFNADGRVQVTPEVETFADVSLGDTRLSGPSPYGAYVTEEQHSSSVRLGLNADTPIGLLGLSAYRNQALVHVFASTSDVAALLGESGALAQVHDYENQTVTVVQASDLVKLGPDHTVRVGLEFRDNRDSAVMANGSISNRIYAASAMWDWQVTPTVSITNAVRLDHVQVGYGGTLVAGSGFTTSQYNATTMTEPSFNSGVVWRVTEQDTLRLTSARGVRMPTLLDQALQSPPGEPEPLAVLGRPNLRPSVVYNIELDYDRAIPQIGSTLRTALFWQRTDDVISWPLVITPGGMLAVMAGNVGYTTASGVEIGLKGRSESGWRWNASYALAVTTDHTSDRAPSNMGTELIATGNNACSAPRNVVIAGLGYSVGRWEADLNARWQSRFCDYREGPTPLQVESVTIGNYLTMTARIGYRLLDNVTVALTAQQLNQASLVQTAGPPFERRIIASVSANF
jgi:iron complex outermembrane receptor protein